jgi:hypothetical protein
MISSANRFPLFQIMLQARAICLLNFLPSGRALFTLPWRGRVDADVNEVNDGGGVG